MSRVSQLPDAGLPRAGDIIVLQRHGMKERVDWGSFLSALGFPPLGFVYLTDPDGARLTDADGARLMESV